MKQSLKIGAVTLAVAVVASSGMAFAQSSSDDTTPTTTAVEQQERLRPRPAFHLAKDAADFLGMERSKLAEALQSGQTLVEVAEANGVSEADLVAFLVQDVTDHVTRAVENGRLTQEQADEILADAEVRISEYVHTVNPVPEGRPHPGLHGMREAAEFLGIEPASLAEALQAGQTLGEIAEANGSNQAALIEYLIADATDHINQAVADGKLTREEADEKLAGLEEKVTEFVTTPQPIRDGLRDRVQENRQEMVGIVTNLLGITSDGLQAAFEEGTPLADLAAEQGVSVDDLVDALAAPAEERLAAAVADGAITQEQADERIAMIRERIGERVENPPADRPARDGLRPGRFGAQAPTAGTVLEGVSTVA